MNQEQREQDEIRNRVLSQVYSPGITGSASPHPLERALFAEAASLIHPLLPKKDVL